MKRKKDEREAEFLKGVHQRLIMLQAKQEERTSQKSRS